MGTPRSAAPAVALLLVLVPTASALAATAAAEDKKAAEKAMAEGTKLFNEGALEAAIERFEAARSAAPSAAGPLRALGATYARMDRCVDAVAPLEEFLVRKTEGPDVVEARETLDRCRKLLVTRTTLSVTANVVGATVRLDSPGGVVFGTAPVDRVLVPAGEHAVYLSARGYVPAESRVVAALGRDTALHVEMMPAAATAGPAPAPAAEPAKKGRVPWLWIGVAGGGALVVAGAIAVGVAVAAGGGPPDTELGPPFRL